MVVRSTITDIQAWIANTCREVHQGECAKHIGPRGGVHLSQTRWLVNGKTKIWITRPLEFRIPIKRGLYEHSYITQDNYSTFHTAENCPLVLTYPLGHKTGVQVLYTKSPIKNWRF